MSLLLNQPSKLGLGKPALMRSSLFLSNGLSSSSVRIPPCSINGCGLKVKIVTNGRRTYFAKKDDGIVSFNKEDEKKWLAYKGWVATYNGDGIVHFIEETGEQPKHFSLPPFVTLPHCQTQIVTNVVMSTPSPEDEDCVVAVKFLGPQLSFIRPAQSNSEEWTNVRIENPCFYTSQVMFSKKDGMFRIPGSRGHIIGSWDLHTDTHKPKIQRLRFRNLPELTKTQRELLESCCTSEFLLIESQSTDETFLVRWYKKSSRNILSSKAVMVFKLDDKGNAIYTQDIGELCILLSGTELLCEPASSNIYLLRPNHVEIYDVYEFFTLNLANSPHSLVKFCYD